MKSFFLLLLTLFFIAGTSSLFGQDTDSILPPDLLSEVESLEKRELPSHVQTQPSASHLDQLTQELHMRKINNLHIEVMAICTLCFLALLINSMLMFKSNKFHAQDLINSNGLVLIIFGTILVIMLSESEQQLTAAVGILGAVAGYLFGTMKKEQPEAIPQQIDP